MKKILLLLLFTIASYGQAVFDEGIQIKNNTTDNSATKVNVQSTDGTINTISKSDLVNVVEVTDVPSLPLIGEVGKIYVVKNINKIYRWNGTFYQELAGSDLTYQSIIAALTFTPENVANKATDFTTVNNTLYPTVQAVSDGTSYKRTIAQIRALTGTLPNASFYTTDLGKEGHWYYDSTDTTSADNTGTVLVTSDGKRIRRVVGNFLKLKWFGAVGDGVTDETSILQNAINESSVNRVKLVLDKSKTYITGTLVPKNNLFIDLNGSTLKLKANTNNLLFNGEEASGNNFSVVNGTLDGNKVNNQIDFNKSGGGIWLRSWDYVRFENLQMNNFFRAVLFISVNNYLVVKNVEVNDCGLSNAFGRYSYGLETELCNNMVVENLSITNMYGYGVHFLNTVNAKADGLFFNNMNRLGESIAITTTNSNLLDISNVKVYNVDGDNIEINSTKNSNFKNIEIDSSGDIALLFGDHFVTGVSNENINISGLKITNTGGTNSLSLNNLIYCSFTDVQADKGMQTLDLSFYANDRDNSISNSKFGVNLQQSFVYYKKFNLSSVNFTNFYINKWDRNVGVVSNAQVGNSASLTVVNAGVTYISFADLNQYGPSGNIAGKLKVNSIFNNQQASYQECLFIGSNNHTTLNLGFISQVDGSFGRPMTITTDPANDRIVLTNSTGVSLTVFWTVEVLNNN